MDCKHLPTLSHHLTFTILVLPHAEHLHPPNLKHDRNQIINQNPIVSTDISRCSMWFVPFRLTARLALHALQYPLFSSVLMVSSFRCLNFYSIPFPADFVKSELLLISSSLELPLDVRPLKQTHMPARSQPLMLSVRHYAVPYARHDAITHSHTHTRNQHGPREL
jgi:hypothetical protein